MKKFIKTVYNLIPFKMVFFSALKVIWKPKESIYKHLHFKSIFKVYINKTKGFKINHYGYQIENEIFWAGLSDGWEKESINLWVKLCEKSEIIFDIGANTGVYCLIAKAINPNAKVYAFEPVSRVFSKLQENIQLNNFDIVAIEKAASNMDGKATIYDSDSEHTYSVTVNKNMSSQGTATIETEINTITLNSFIKQNGIKKVDLIKIDVETHEPEVLEGFSEYLLEHKPTLLIEILTDAIGEKVSALVRGSDYLYFNIDEKRGIRQVDVITKSDYFNYLLCNSSIAKELGLIKKKVATNQI
jgi:FkbM family methyltransferase